MERIYRFQLCSSPHIPVTRRFVSKAIMFCVVIIGHSLVPRNFNSPPGTSCHIFRKPGGCFSDENCSEFQGLWEDNFDLVIVYLGGNDLTYLGEIEVYNRARDFITRVSEHARIAFIQKGVTELTLTASTNANEMSSTES